MKARQRGPWGNQRAYIFGNFASNSIRERLLILWEKVSRQAG